MTGIHFTFQRGVLVSIEDWGEGGRQKPRLTVERIGDNRFRYHNTGPGCGAGSGSIRWLHEHFSHEDKDLLRAFVKRFTPERAKKWFPDCAIKQE